MIMMRLYPCVCVCVRVCVTIDGDNVVIFMCVCVCTCIHDILLDDDDDADEVMFPCVCACAYVSVYIQVNQKRTLLDHDDDADEDEAHDELSCLGAHALRKTVRSLRKTVSHIYGLMICVMVYLRQIMTHHGVSQSDHNAHITQDDASQESGGEDFTYTLHDLCGGNNSNDSMGPFSGDAAFNGSLMNGYKIR
jgi:hypothetical protein